MNSLAWYALLYGGLLLLSAVFSGSETAFFSIQARIRDYGGEAIPSQVRALLGKPRQLLVTILTGNTLVNIAMGFLAALMATQLARAFGLNQALALTIESIIVALVILLFGDIMPKMLAVRRSELFARLASPSVRLLVWVLYPIGWVVYGVVHIITRFIRLRPEEVFASEEDLKDLAEVGVDRGALARSETEIIHSIFEFTDTTVNEVMVPRVDILALESRSTLENALALIREKQVSKIPIYKETIDDIRGILYAKDILPYLEGPHPEVNLIKLSRPPFFIPRGKQVLSLLQDFKDRRTSIAIVLDEYGGTAGLVTLEDVVEEVLGEMRDPYDLQESEIRQTAEGEWLVDASLPLDDLEDDLKCRFPEEREYETLGGFLFDMFDKVPTLGQDCRYAGYRFIVQRLDGNRIEKVRVVKIEQETGGEHEQT